MQVVYYLCLLTYMKMNSWCFLRVILYRCKYKQTKKIVSVIGFISCFVFIRGSKYEYFVFENYFG